MVKSRYWKIDLEGLKTVNPLFMYLREWARPCGAFVNDPTISIRRNKWSQSRHDQSRSKSRSSPHQAAGLILTANYVLAYFSLHNAATSLLPPRGSYTPL